MTEKPAPALVSVLMVVRNEQDRIRDAIASVLGQSHSALELLVIDGGSTDRTEQIVNELAERDDRVILLQNPRQIIPSGLNVGLAKAGGSYVARLDGHSRWDPQYLETALADLERRPDLGGVGGKRFGVAAGPTGRAIAAALSSPLGVGNSVYHYGREQQETDHVTAGVYRADAAHGNGGWDEDLPVNEDVDFDFRLRRAGFTLLYDPRMLTEWQVRESIGDFFFQYRRYGRGKAAMVRKNGMGAVRLRHLGAPALVLSLVASGLGAVRGARAAAAAVPVTYASTISLGAWAIARRRGNVSIETQRLAAALGAMHVGWGLGFLEGLVLGSRPASSTAKPRTLPPRLTDRGGPTGGRCTSAGVDARTRHPARSAGAPAAGGTPRPRAG
ncbi:glycosyltransferase family 2 protein [Pseudonocardia charpentierae]|uniref:Glycosyltransferase family 2 protein n=1 Tax=Pseudonocardia charpentierae TaxID=3075545 RepID=A0ABU2NIG5_9PSEU|nr:glycosyltransferase family 2 protein [Pseudonocardia sp. DSM 45834]MDT0353500.1 glycosyltransferase family 2 protein [Pseudonocardia sp. DSM 45834]